MAFNNEIEEVKAQIKMLEKKLSFLEELSKTKSPVEEAYKDWWGEYPGTKNWTSDATRWQGFQAGYEFAYAISTAKEVMEKVQEEQKWDAVRESVKWCEEHPDWDLFDCLKPQTEKEVKKLQEKEWDIKVETDYLTGKARHKTKIVDKDGNDYKPEPLTTEELLKPQPEKRKIDDLAEKLLPDDHPYKITDEHGETTR